MVKFHKEKGCSIITLPTLLYVTYDFIRIRDELSDLAEEIEGDDEINAVILTSHETISGGEGKRLKEILIALNEIPLERIRFSEVFKRIDRPVIAAIPKGASGPWAELILWCDIRIASYEAYFSFPHVLEGLIPWDGATQKLPRIVGVPDALELLLTGKAIDAKEAERIALVNRVVHKEKLLEEAMNIAKELTGKSPQALRFIREAIHQGMDIPIDHALRLEGDLYLLLYTSADREEGIRAFKERRTPHFRGK